MLSQQGMFCPNSIVCWNYLKIGCYPNVFVVSSQKPSVGTTLQIGRHPNLLNPLIRILEVGTTLQIGCHSNNKQMASWNYPTNWALFQHVSSYSLQSLSWNHPTNWVLLQLYFRVFRSAFQPPAKDVQPPHIYIFRSFCFQLLLIQCLHSL